MYTYPVYYRTWVGNIFALNAKAEKQSKRVKGEEKKEESVTAVGSGLA
ncbi:MAG: hypothetical protein PVJ52_03270 [Candidatus Woesebacteria bacterium]|jgi:hypothetical protein